MTEQLTATMIGRVNYATASGQQYLWELSRTIAPLDHWSGEGRKPYRTRHVITSYISNAFDHGGSETFVFPATPAGTITDWGELHGSDRDVSHEDAIAGFLAAHNQEAS